MFQPHVDASGQLNHFQAMLQGGRVQANASRGPKDGIVITTLLAIAPAPKLRELEIVIPVNKGITSVSLVSCLTLHRLLSALACPVSSWHTSRAVCTVVDVSQRHTTLTHSGMLPPCMCSIDKHLPCQHASAEHEPCGMHRRRMCTCCPG